LASRRIDKIRAGLFREERLVRNYPLQYFACGSLCILLGLVLLIAGRGYGLIVFGLAAYAFAWFYAARRNWR
jgi:hypothetical protein